MTDTQKTESELKEIRTQLIQKEFGVDPYKATADELIHLLTASAYRMDLVRKDLKQLDNVIKESKKG